MLDAVLIGVLSVGLAWGRGRAVWGRPPAPPVKPGTAIVLGAVIQFGFHAAATAAPSMATVVALVLTGWITFALWSVWLARAKIRRLDDGHEGDGGGSGPRSGG